MITGRLISESLRVGAELAGVPLRVVRIWRVEVGSATPEQPQQWTLFDFQAADADAGRLADGLADCLSATGGWYVDFHTEAETFVVFAGRVFRYPRGDEAGRAEARRYALGVGVPEAQLDWGR